MKLCALFVVTIFAACAVPADAATWRVGPDPCPAPAAAGVYRPDPNVISPDARDGTQPGARKEPRHWPPAVLTAELPRAWAGGSAYLWFDGEMIAGAANGPAFTPNCDASGAAPQ